MSTDQAHLLADLLRMRVDVGHLSLAHTMGDKLQASFKEFNAGPYVAEIGDDPVAMFIKLLGPKDGETMDQLRARALAGKPKLGETATPSSKRQPTEAAPAPKKKKMMDDDVL